MKDRERQAQLRSLWLQRPDDKRTEHNVLVFCGEIKRTRPELLKAGDGDVPYQYLKVDLRGLITS